MNEEIIKLKQDMDRLFAGIYRDFSGQRLIGHTPGESPIASLSEDQDAVVVRIELAGIDPENVDVVVAEDILEISSASKQQYSQDNRLVEQGRAFAHRLKLPCRIKTDEVQARHREGILEIVMPKCKPTPGRHLKIVKS